MPFCPSPHFYRANCNLFLVQWSLAMLWRFGSDGPGPGVWRPFGGAFSPLSTRFASRLRALPGNKRQHFPVANLRRRCRVKFCHPPHSALGVYDHYFASEWCGSFWLPLLFNRVFHGPCMDWLLPLGRFSNCYQRLQTWNMSNHWQPNNCRRGDKILCAAQVGFVGWLAKVPPSVLPTLQRDAWFRIKYENHHHRPHPPPWNAASEINHPSHRILCPICAEVLISDARLRFRIGGLIILLSSSMPQSLFCITFILGETKNNSC